MINAIRGRASYANVMSTIAVVLALGGGAYAATKTTSKTIKNNTIKSVDQKDGKAVAGVDVVPDSLGGGQILEPSLAQVPSAASASSADAADQADTADLAETAANGLEGWAVVAPSGGFTSSAGMAPGTVTREAEGLYCFDDLPFNPRALAVTGHESASSISARNNFFTGSAVANSNANCPGSEDAWAESRNDDDDGFANAEDAAFYVLFFSAPAP